MKNIFTAFILTFLLALSVPLYSQSWPDTNWTGGMALENDTTETVSAEQAEADHRPGVIGWLSQLGIRLKDQKKVDRRMYSDRPSIEFNYYYSGFKSEAMNSVLGNEGLLQMGIGYEYHSRSGFSEHVKSIQSHYFKLAIMNDDLTYEKKPAAQKGNYNMWQLGWNKNNGHGIEFSEDFYLIPYYSFGFTGTQFKLKDNAFNGSRADSAFLRRFDNKFRLGHMIESGVRVKLFNAVSLKAGYIRNIVLPGVLFWKQSGSYLIDVSAMAILENFTDDITRGSPYMGTIFKYALQGALLYGLTELRHEKMAWPFASEAPLYNDSFSFGLSFMF